MKLGQNEAKLKLEANKKYLEDNNFFLETNFSEFSSGLSFILFHSLSTQKLSQWKMKLGQEKVLAAKQKKNYHNAVLSAG